MTGLLPYLGESLKLVASRLGQSSETLVQTTYGHLLPGQDRAAVDRLSGLLEDGTGLAHGKDDKAAG